MSKLKTMGIVTKGKIMATVMDMSQTYSVENIAMFVEAPTLDSVKMAEFNRMGLDKNEYITYRLALLNNDVTEAFVLPTEKEPVVTEIEKIRDPQWTLEAFKRLGIDVNKQFVHHFEVEIPRDNAVIERDWQAPIIKTFYEKAGQLPKDQTLLSKLFGNYVEKDEQVSFDELVRCSEIIKEISDHISSSAKKMNDDRRAHPNNNRAYG
ncbi:MAG: hypothetical protein LBC75_05475 [Fibromonadaceae bacterium]|jgi:hypothetical protein|nr:hypothetical protein [Fibromonadaceae bacterium]